MRLAGKRRCLWHGRRIPLDILGRGRLLSISPPLSCDGNFGFVSSPLARAMMLQRFKLDFNETHTSDWPCFLAYRFYRSIG